MKKAWFIVALFTGCITETTTELETCDLTIDHPETEFVAGDSVLITGTPFTTVLDTSVRFSGVDADVVAVNRTDCTLCESCRVSAGCSACDTCVACVTSCEPCEETTQLTIPDLEAGKYTVVFRNQYGQSIPSQWTILQPSDNFDTGSDEPSE